MAISRGYSYNVGKSKPGFSGSGPKRKLRRALERC